MDNQNALYKTIDEHLAEDSELIKGAIDSDRVGVANLTKYKIFDKYWLKIITNDGKVYKSHIAEIIPIDLNKIVDGVTITVDTKFVNFTGDYDVILRLYVKKFDDGSSIIIGLPLDNDLAESYKKLIVKLVITLILISISIFFMTKFLLRPLADISLSLRRLSEDKFYRGFVKKSDDEIGYLVDGINTTFEKLKNYYTQQKNFLTIMSHELKTPLSVIKNHVEFALARDDVPLDIKSKFANDLEQISRVNQFIHRLLLLTRLEDSTILPDISIFNLSELLEELTLFFVDLAEAQNRKLLYNIEQNITVQGDKELLNRAISNIIDNAVKYTPDGKSVSVSLKTTDNFIVLSIMDGGEAIPSNIISAAQNSRFISSQYDADGVKNGIGLRLIIAILNLHGITYTINQTGDGNLFEIYLPKIS